MHFATLLTLLGTTITVVAGTSVSLAARHGHHNTRQEYQGESPFNKCIFQKF